MTKVRVASIAALLALSPYLAACGGRPVAPLPLPGGTGGPGESGEPGAPGVPPELCAVRIHNATSFTLDVSYTVRGPRLPQESSGGTLASDASMMVNTDCGSMVSATGEGGGRSFRGSARAGHFGGVITFRS